MSKYYGLIMPAIYGTGDVRIKSLKQTAESKESGGKNIITEELMNGHMTEFVIRNGQGLKSTEQSESTDENGLRSNTVKLNSSAPDLVEDVAFTVKDGVGVRSHGAVSQTDANKVVSKTLTISYTDGTSDSIVFSDASEGVAAAVKSLSDERAERQEQISAEAAERKSADEALLAQISQISGGSGAAEAAAYTETTHSALLASVTAGTLTPGMLYRITDYTCATSQAETQSAGHVFDIVVRALDASHLDENARAVQHSGDTYFADSKLSAWRLKYSVQNNTSRFAWASDEGKGVVYGMTDEFGNTCPYDFKNIQFKRFKVTATTGTATDLRNGYYGCRDVATGSLYPPESTISTTDSVWRYTFDRAGEDDSLNTHGAGSGGEWAKTCRGNVIKPLYPESIYNGSSSISLAIRAQALNNIVFLGSSASSGCYCNTFGDSCYSNTFGSGCRSNTFGDSCRSNTFGWSCFYNTFGDNCYSNTFGSDCFYNTFGDNCYSNTFGSDCFYNTLGSGCRYNTFGWSCYSNTFSDSCRSNTFGDNCYSNTFGSDCRSNTFSNNCDYNTFGTSCYSNTLGSGCRSNTFGDSCHDNTLSTSCYSNTLGSSCFYNTFGTSCRYNTLSDSCYSNTLSGGSRCYEHYTTMPSGTKRVKGIVYMDYESSGSVYTLYLVNGNSQSVTVSGRYFCGDDGDKDSAGSDGSWTIEGGAKAEIVSFDKSGTGGYAWLSASYQISGKTISMSADLVF